MLKRFALNSCMDLIHMYLNPQAYFQKKIAHKNWALVTLLHMFNLSVINDYD